MNIAYWILAGLLALFYLYAGAMKVSRTREQLRPMMAWVDRLAMPAVRSIGAVEFLGALGLVLPPLTGVAPALALAAALGLATLQIGAILVHLNTDRRIGINIPLLIGAAGTVWLATTWL
ncbi:DoxX family protein [Streptomyces sp. NPDC001828]|uniref:DoxX family protein n=1 Tax=Streptomyces sp. NPDC001828 TaxID=3364615 RepID=UPI0036D0C47E